MDIINRKRMRSEESPNWQSQSKCFVNEKTLEQNDLEKMKLIHDKTLRMLFKGAKNHQLKVGQANILNNNNDGEKVDLDSEKVEDIGCKLCNKKILSSILVSCKNCNLGICGSCRVKCQICETFICGNCFLIFGCSMESEPLCENCQMFVD